MKLNDDMDLIEQALTNDPYEAEYGRRKHEYPSLSTPENVQAVHDDRKTNAFEQEGLRNPKRQNTPTVHPSRYNALPIGK